MFAARSCALDRVFIGVTTFTRRKQSTTAPRQRRQTGARVMMNFLAAIQFIKDDALPFGWYRSVDVNGRKYEGPPSQIPNALRYSMMNVAADIYGRLAVASVGRDGELSLIQIFDYAGPA
jgi:hypothetical protein